MPRQPRTASGTGIYHVMLRGINRQDIFEETEDYVRMLSCLQQMLEQYDDQGNRLQPSFPPSSILYTSSFIHHPSSIKHHPSYIEEFFQHPSSLIHHKRSVFVKDNS